MNQKVSGLRFASLFSTFAALAGLLLLLTATGCKSFVGPGSASFASVTIKSQSPQEIAKVTSMVFGEDGYRGGMANNGQMVFDQEASRATSYAREGIAGGFYGAQTINRVRVELVPLADGSYRLQCKAYMVTGGGGPYSSLQDEVPLANFRSGPYQLLLNKVKSRLN